MVHRYAFEEAVISHMMSDVAYGVLLSGGLDSSLCASVMSRYVNLFPMPFFACQKC